MVKKVFVDNLVWHEVSITKKQRHDRNRHKSCILWLTGLSGAGKSTLANAIEKELFARRKQSYILDGDNIRHGLNQGLGFSDEDRKENIRRIGEVAKLFVDAGVIVATAFISPFKEDRQLVREIVDEGEFIEIYVKAPLQVCEDRDPKGLYKKARNGQIMNFTGIDSPYEEPQEPEIVIDTEQLSIVESVEKVISYLVEREVI